MTDESNNPNPIRIFFSKDNAQALYSYIQRGLDEQYAVKIGSQYMGELIEIMKMVLEPLPKRIPADVDQKWLINTLNQQTLKEALPIFADIAKGEALPPALGEKDRTLPRNAQRDAEVAMPNARMSLGAPGTRPQSTPLGSLPDDEEQFQKLRQLRSVKQENQEIPHFEDPPHEYADDVNDLYENAEQQRQYRDIIPPPHNEPPQEGFSTQYGTSLADLQREEAVDSFDPNAFIGSHAPRGTERVNRQMVKPRQLDMEHHSDIGHMLSFEDIAPQPAQMSLLIPKNSRNVVHDSQTIPHIFIVNSRDRNPATYPNPSEYRLELRQPYVDVVSVQLTAATIPLTAFNINASNNVILFEEDAGTTLSASIPIGNYPDAVTLGISIAASMTAASVNGVTYTSAVNSLTNKLTLISDGAGGSIFSLLFFGDPTLEGEGTPEYRREKPQYPPNSIGAVAGFDTFDYTGSLLYEAPFVPLLGGEPDVFLHIDEFELLESNNTEVHNAFAVIELTGVNFARFRPMDGHRFVKYFSPPKGKLAYLTISLRNSQGQLIDFNGAEHCFTLEVITKDKTQGPYDETIHERQT